MVLLYFKTLYARTVSESQEITLFYRLHTLFIYIAMPNESLISLKKAIDMKDKETHFKQCQRSEYKYKLKVVFIKSICKKRKKYRKRVQWERENNVKIPDKN